jgi:hypothetical protein
VFHLAGEDETVLCDLDAGDPRAVRQPPERVREAHSREQLLRHRRPERPLRLEDECSIPQNQVPLHRDGNVEAQHPDL